MAKDWLFREINRSYNAYGWRNREILYADDARRFILAGHAIFTIEHLWLCRKKHNFRVRESGTPDKYAVSVEGDNGHWNEIGTVDSSSLELQLNEGSGQPSEGSAITDFEYLLWSIKYPKKYFDLPDGFVVQHNGRCGQCNCQLKHPRSVAIGVCARCNRTLRSRWAPLVYKPPYSKEFLERQEERVREIVAKVKAERARREPRD